MVTTHRLPYQDYADLEGDERYELLAGRLVPVQSRNTAHQTVSIKLWWSTDCARGSRGAMVGRSSHRVSRAAKHGRFPRATRSGPRAGGSATAGHPVSCSTITI